jgi:hypothetical protein
MSFLFFKKKVEPLEEFKTSPGKLKLYLQCPLKYRYCHLQMKKGSPRPDHHLVFDSLMKKHLDSFQKQLIDPLQDISQETLLQNIEHAWNPDDFTEAENPHEFHAAAHQSAVNATRWLSCSAGQRSGSLFPGFRIQ